jgi:hypothetical protein
MGAGWSRSPLEEENMNVVIDTECSSEDFFAQAILAIKVALEVAKGFTPFASGLPDTIRIGREGNTFISAEKYLGEVPRRRAGATRQAGSMEVVRLTEHVVLEVELFDEGRGPRWFPVRLFVDPAVFAGAERGAYSWDQWSPSTPILVR